MRRELTAMRTGRASLAMLDGIRVDYYGTPTPLNQVGNLSIPDPTLITIQPWDPSLLQAIEKAIRAVRPRPQPAERRQDHPHARFPPLTEERRKVLVKHAHKHAEEGRVAVRNVRRDVNEHLKKLLKDHEISEDDEKQAMAEVQKLTDQHIEKIDEILKKKEARGHGGLRARLLLALAAALFAAACFQERLDVDITTRIHPDGTCERRIEYRLEHSDTDKSGERRRVPSIPRRTLSAVFIDSPPVSPGGCATKPHPSLTWWWWRTTPSISGWAAQACMTAGRITVWSANA